MAVEVVKAGRTVRHLMVNSPEGRHVITRIDGKFSIVPGALPRPSKKGLVVLCYVAPAKNPEQCSLPYPFEVSSRIWKKLYTEPASAERLVKAITLCREAGKLIHEGKMKDTDVNWSNFLTGVAVTNMLTRKDWGNQDGTSKS